MMWSVRFAVSTIANSVLTVVIVVTGANTISRSYQVRFLRTLKCHYASGPSLCISLTIFFSSDSLSRIVFFFILSKTRTGRHIYAIGSNVDAAKLSGVNVVSTTVKTYLVSSVCSCVVGLILCAQAGMGNMEAGNMYEMYGVAAGVIGGVSPLGGTGILLGTFAGAAVWQTLENGLNMIGAQVGIQRVVIGVIVVVAVLLDVVVRNGKFGKRK